MITEADAFFRDGCGRCARFATDACSARLWAAPLAALRAICLDLGLTETAGWGHPVYRHDGQMIALIGAFRDDLRLSFFQPGLLVDPEGQLERAGPNTRFANMLRFTTPEAVAEREATIRAFLRQAMDHAEKGLKQPPAPPDADLPAELVEALDDDPLLAEAFQALTPGRQRSYVIALSSARKPETRRSRILGFRDRILAGRGANER